MIGFLQAYWIYVAAGAALATSSAILAIGPLYRRAGFAELNCLRWNAYQGLVRQALAAMGYSVDLDRGNPPGHDYHFDVSRDARRFLVICKEGETTRLTARQVMSIDQSVGASAAAGAFVFTTGTVAADARALCGELNVKVFDGEVFWAAVRGCLTAQQRRSIRSRMFLGAFRHLRRGAIAALLVASLGAGTLAWRSHQDSVRAERAATTPELSIASVQAR